MNSDSEPTFVVQRIRRSWHILPRVDGWPFRRTYPTKWKATLALEVWENGGRASDYFAAARAKKHKTRRRPGVPTPDGKNARSVPFSAGISVVSQKPTTWARVGETAGCLGILGIWLLLGLAPMLPPLFAVWVMREVDELIGRILVSACGGGFFLILLGNRDYWYSVNMGAYIPRPSRGRITGGEIAFMFFFGFVITWLFVHP